MTTPSTNDESTTSPGQKYTALVYFHGMGSQRRYEEVGYLVQQLGNLIYRDRKLYDKAVEIELGRPGSGLEGSPVTYYRVNNWHPEDKRLSSNQSAVIRFYDAYWASHTAGGTSASSVIWWVLNQVFRPFDILRARWGEVRELRVSTLYAIYEQQQRKDWQSGRKHNTYFDKLVEDLILVYYDFVQPESRAFPKSDGKKDGYRSNGFTDFIKFLEGPETESSASHVDVSKLKLSDDHFIDVSPPRRKELTDLAWRWYKADLETQWYSLVRTLALVALIACVFTLTVWFAGSITLDLLQAWPDVFRASRHVLEGNSNAISGDWNVLRRLGICTLVWALLLWARRGLHDFLQDYLGDVQQYVTYQETDVKYQRRTAILKDTKALLHHVLLDPMCERVIVVAHSLGTVIAYDTLLELRHGVGDTIVDTKNLTKIQHFVTMGSPIDKVEYFFAAVQSKVPRYLDMVRAWRGDITDIPFTYKECDKPQKIVSHIHWVNYWGQGDLVSDPIHSVVGKHIGSVHVDNVRVASHWLPEPVHCHQGYFDNQYVLEDIFAMTFDNAYNFVDKHQQWPVREWLAASYEYSDDPPTRQYPSRRLEDQVTAPLDRPDKHSNLLYTLHRIMQRLIVGGSVGVALFLGIVKIAWVLWPTHIPEPTGFVHQWISSVQMLGDLLLPDLSPRMLFIMLFGTALLLWWSVSLLLRPRFSVNPERTQHERGNRKNVKVPRHASSN